MRSLSMIVACAAVAGCQRPSRSADEVGPPAPAAHADPGKPLVQAIAEVQERMHVRYAATSRMHQAIALSDLPRAKEEARIVADLDEPDILPQWQPYVQDIRSAAQHVLAVEDPAAAAGAMAVLGRSCARCHTAVHAKIAFPETPPPASSPPAPDLRATMAMHHWAESRMWEGLIAPAVDRWNEGARALEGAPLTITAETGELGIADDVSRIRLLARRALDAETLDARATLYGELLGTCVGCHHVIRDR